MIVLIFLTIILSILSYTLVDLNLTLLNWQPYLQIQNSLTQLGYFNRPLNGSLFLLLFVSLLIIYPISVLKNWHPFALRNTVLAVGIILSLGYTAFSHDLFNYIFDAKMITTYGVNPYEYRALDFPQDTWVRFMHWTHRTYPYGPVWLAITVIPSLLGMGVFILTFLLFKSIFLLSYLLAAWSIYQIMHLLESPTKASTATALFAFNPLVLVDGLLSPHLDLTMAALGLFATYLALRHRYLTSGLVLLLSAGTKFITLPWLLILNPFVAKKLSQSHLTSAICVLSLLLGSAQTFSQMTYQPWYGLLGASTLPLLTPHLKMKYLIIAGILLSLPMWIYLHFAYTGEWVKAVPLF